MIQVIHRALNIMEYVAADPDRPKELGDIAEGLKLHAATCANIIKTLVTRQYLVKLEKQKGYLIGPMFHRLGVKKAELKPETGPGRKRVTAAASQL